MKLWHIAALLVGAGVIMVIIRNMQTTKQNVSTGATSNDVLLGFSKFGSGLLDLGGKIFTPSAVAPDSYRDIREESTDDLVKRLNAGYGTE